MQTNHLPLSFRIAFKMHSTTSTTTILLLALAASSVVVTIPLDPIVRSTSSGTLIGKRVQLTSETQHLNDVYSFLGVPYAQPPVGERRFEKPAPLNVSSDSYQMVQEFKPTCIQMKHFSQAISPLLDVDLAHNVSSRK